jgi:tRNA-modifying protein YgfZ
VSTIVSVVVTSEYELLNESAGVVDRSDRAKFLVRGGEAAEFLQGQVSNDVESLAPGTGCYAVILNHKGKLRTDLRVLRGQDFFWLDTEPIGHAVVAHMLRTYAVGRDVGWDDVSAARALVSVVGPAARGLFEGPEHAFEERDGRMYVATALGVDVIGEPGLELDFDTVSEEAVECLRIESGRPRLGFDMDAETMPQEAGINERAISFTKGCYVGQETVARLHYRGKPNRHLRGLRLAEAAERGTDVLLGEKVVGRLGSVCVSPRLGPIGLALVRREAAPGDTVSVAGAEAELVALPFDRD